eukprot:1821479-Prymnesium_polylepis.2
MRRAPPGARIRPWQHSCGPAPVWPTRRTDSASSRAARTTLGLCRLLEDVWGALEACGPVARHACSRTYVPCAAAAPTPLDERARIPVYCVPLSFCESVRLFDCLSLAGRLPHCDLRACRWSFVCRASSRARPREYCRVAASCDVSGRSHV